MFTEELRLLFLVVLVAEAIWWLAWIGLSLSRRRLPQALFLIATLIVWLAVAVPAYANFPNGTSIILGIVLGIAPFLFLPSMVRTIAEYQRGILFRFGQLVGVVNPGLNIIFPFGIDRLIKIDMRTFTIDVAKQEVITKDNIPVMVDAVVYFNVFDPVLSVIKVANYTQSTTLLAQTILRSILGKHDLDEILSNRAGLSEMLRELLDNDTDPWGIKVSAVEIKSIEIPDTMKRAMARQAEAERERRGKVIAAEGEYEASRRLAEAAVTLGTAPAALQLRYLQTLTEISVEKNSTIIFPLPMDLIGAFLDRNHGGSRQPPENRRPSEDLIAPDVRIAPDDRSAPSDSIAPDDQAGLDDRSAPNRRRPSDHEPHTFL